MELVLLDEPQHDASDNSSSQLTETIAFKAIIQFTASILYCSEDEGEAVLDILRLGDVTQASKCSFRTKDGSAKDGQKYIGVSGQVAFAPGERQKAITVQLIGDPVWNATLEFKVFLESPQNAQLGRYLFKCSVKIVNDDPFPGNRYREKLINGEEQDISGSTLFYDYMILMLRNEKIRSDTWKTVLLDQLRGLYFFAGVYLQMYLVDVVLAPAVGEEIEHDEEDGRRRLMHSVVEGTAGMIGSIRGRLLTEDATFKLGALEQYIPQDKHEQAVAVGLLYIAPFILLHAVDIFKCYSGIPCEVRKVLQTNLMRQFLNYKEDVRNHMKHCEVIMVMIRECIHVADDGYSRALNVLRILGKLCLALVFILSENRIAAVPLFVYPVVLGCWLALRQHKTINIYELKCEKQDEMVESIEFAAEHYDLISDFHLREPVCYNFEETVDDFHNTEGVACAVLCNNSYAAPWLTTLFVGCGYAVSAFTVSTVSDGNLSLGAFLASINVFKEVGAEIYEIYQECMAIQLSFGPLMKITHYMNSGTDLDARMTICRARQQEGKQARAEARANLTQEQKDAGVLGVDAIKLLIKDLSFTYQSFHTPVKIFDHLNMSFDQGKLCAFVGPPREGKSTLLKLLGQSLFPQEGCGDIFIPSHLRVLHVSRDASVLRKASFIENIIMGTSLKEVGGMNRIMDICRYLGFAEKMLEHLTEDCSAVEKLNAKWAAELSHTDYARLNLARVLALNPEVVVIHKPALLFDDHERTKVVQILREHVEGKGLFMPVESYEFRRPRTLFFTSMSATAVRQAHVVYKVSMKAGVQEISLDDIDNGALM